MRDLKLLLLYHGNKGDFGYNLSVNGSFAKNKVVFNYDTPGIPDYQKTEGNPMIRPVSLPGNWCFPKTPLLLQPILIWAGAQPGDLIFKDVNMMVKIDGLDRFMDKKTAMPTFIGRF